MKPLISIITVTYQAESYLRRTMESVLSQDYTNIEYIVIDGNSKDKTVIIIKEFEAAFLKKGHRFRWRSEPDMGIYDAMNKALKMATGDYLWFMNAGDRIASENILSSLISGLSTINKNDLNNLPDFIYGETYIVNDQGAIMGERRLKAPEILTWKSFHMGMLVCHQSMLVKSTIAPLFDLRYRYSADFDWTIRCLRKAKNIHNTHLVLSHFLDGGVSKKKMRASLKERFRIMAFYYGWVSTILHHFWFIFRAAWFKINHGWI